MNSGGTTSTITATTTTAPNTTTTHNEVVHTTANHLFLTADHGWLLASFMHVGEPVVTANGTTATIVAIHAVPGAASMWDLTVSQVHTSAVGNGQAVVHNTECIPVKSLIHENSALVKEAEKAGSNQTAQRDIDNLIQRYREGNINPGKGNGSLFNDIRYLRGDRGARVFFRMADGTMEILAKSSKANEQRVIDILYDMYDR